MGLASVVVLVAVVEKKGEIQAYTLSHLAMKHEESPCQMIGNTSILDFSVLGLWEMNFFLSKL